MVVAQTGTIAKQARKQARREAKLKSLLGQLAWWGSPERKEQFTREVLKVEVDRIEKARARLKPLVCSTTWGEDVDRLPDDKGGEYPPADDAGKPLMVRGRGEDIFYPRAYITTSGYAYDVYIEVLKTGTSRRVYCNPNGTGGQMLGHRQVEAMARVMAALADMPDGYVPGRVSPVDLPRAERDRLHRVEAEAQARLRKGGERMITNVF